MAPVIIKATSLAHAAWVYLRQLLVPRHRRVIRRRLLTWGLSLLATASLVVGIVGYSYIERQLRQDAASLQSELAAATAQRIRDFVRRKIERFADNAKVLSLHPLGSQEQKLLLSLLVKSDSSFSHASLIDAEGMEVLKLSDRKVYFPADLTDQSKSAKFLAAIKGETYIGPVYSSIESQPYVTLAIPLWGPGQSVIGVVAAEADLSFLWEVVGKIHFGDAGYAYLVERHGKLIAHKDASLLLKQQDLRDLDGVKKFLRDPKRNDPAPAYEGKGLSDTSVLTTYAPVPEFGWSVILEEPVEAALATVTALRRSAILFLIFGLLVGTAVIVWLSRRITTPIETLRADVAVIGAGDLQHRAQIATGDEIEELAIEFNKMAEALQSSYANMEQNIDQRTKELAALYSITSAVNASLALDDIWNEVVAKITEIFHFDATRVFLYDDRSESLELRAAFAVDPELRPPVDTVPRGQSIVGRVAESGEAAIFDDIQQDPRYQAWSASKGARSSNLGFLAVFPIKTQVRIFGVMLLTARAPRNTTSAEVRLLTSMAEHLAMAIEKATLFRQSETRARQLAMLNTIGGAVYQSLNLDEVLNQTVEKTIQTLNFDAAWIYLLNSSQEELVLKAAMGLDRATAQALARQPVNDGVSGKVFASKSHWVCEDCQSDASYGQSAYDARIRSLGFASAAGFAIIAKGIVIGVLHLANRTKRHLAPDDLQLIESITHAIGVGVEKSRLLEQIGQDLRRRQILHEVNLAVTSTLDLDEVGKNLIEILPQHLPFTATVALRLFDPAAGRLQSLKGSDTGDRLATLFDTLAMRVLASRQTLALDDLAADGSLPNREILADQAPRSYIGIPLMFGTDCLGVLSLMPRGPGGIGNEDLDLLSDVASQAAMGIHNAQLYRDIVAQKAAVEKAKEMEAAAAAKARFFAMMSHEIRTPLNAVIGLTDLLLHSGLSEDQRNMVDTVKQSGSSLLAVINDILDFSKIDADKVTIEQRPIQTERLVASVIDILSVQAEQKGLRLTSTIAAAVPESIIGDEARIRQVLFNLIGNAVKFTKTGTIEVDVRVAEEKDDGLLLRFAVKDSGVGIPAEAQSQLFQPFSQADSSTTRKYGGTGLGLAICKKLAELMGGQMGLESELSKGSLFWFTVSSRRAEEQPAAAGAPMVAPPPASPGAAAHVARILLVEDNPVNQMVAQRLLNMLGYRADVAADGVEAVAAVEREAYDLLLMDCEMPNMDGYQATALIRQMEKQSGQRRRIVAMTANAMEGDRGKCLDAGMDDYLAKPIQLETLQSVLERCL